MARREIFAVSSSVTFELLTQRYYKVIVTRTGFPPRYDVHTVQVDRHKSGSYFERMTRSSSLMRREKEREFEVLQ